jgi:hypothetical protein
MLCFLSRFFLVSRDEQYKPLGFSHDAVNVISEFVMMWQETTTVCV